MAMHLPQLASPKQVYSSFDFVVLNHCSSFHGKRCGACLRLFLALLLCSLL